VAGVQHLLVRARQMRIFGGVEVQTDEGWAELKAALRALAFRMLA
jgi:hypothetical protein